MGNLCLIYRGDIMNLTSVIKNCVSPYHTVQFVCENLKENGFETLSLSKPWDIKRGGKYIVDCFGAAAVAFTVGKENGPFRLAASHIDVPCFRIKPAPEQTAGGCLKFAVEPYGGMIDNTWLDRPLSIAGTVSVKTDDVLEPKSMLVNFEEPVALIPNLAIHLNREVNKGVAHNYNKTMLPICKTVEDGFNKNSYLIGKIADKIGVNPEDVLFFDLVLYCAQEPQNIGFEKDFVLAPRLDNMTSVLACLEGIAASERENGINVSVFYDNEEVGSRSKQGADSNIISVVLEKLTCALGISKSEYLDMLTAGMLLSCDVAHAIHPNYGEMYDAVNNAKINMGVAVKMNFRQRYPTDSNGVAAIEGLCKKHSIPSQKYMNRADLPGGGTIGADASSILTMRTVDVGVPIWAMHSAVETMGGKDCEALCALVKAFFNE